MNFGQHRAWSLAGLPVMYDARSCRETGLGGVHLDTATDVAEAERKTMGQLVVGGFDSA